MNLENFGQINLDEESQDEPLTEGIETAIIGYWKRDSNSIADEFKCYHYFTVLNPCTRQIKKSDREELGKDKTKLIVTAE